MQRRDVILTAVFGSLGALLLIAGTAAACFYLYRKKRKQREGDEDDSGEEKAESATEKTLSRLNGFLSLKTPLISTKTLG
nr:unnamed protein product [Callosobruchus analis]